MSMDAITIELVKQQNKIKAKRNLLNNDGPNSGKTKE